MIPDDKKEEVRHAADIVDVVSDHVKLRRSGANFMGLCPFHNEKTPSFNVSPKLGIYKCFGCGEGGDVFDFVMKLDGVSFEEAIRSLAERYNVSLPEKGSEAYDPRQHLKDGIYHALRFAGAFYHNVLKDDDEAGQAREYLEKRGYPWKVIRRYGIGYAPGQYDGLLSAAASAGINTEYLRESGLIKKSDRSQGYYDTFRGRIMFPIFNPGGKVIAFGGRTLSDSKKIPKYINSPQTPVYDKSEVLYGIHTAKNEIRKNGEVLLVEGYTDVISMHQAGVGNVVSTSGTALTNRQVHMMRRYGDVLLMIFDADAAGMKAAVRGVKIALEGGMNVRILALPEGEDPDSYIRSNGVEAFSAYKSRKTRNFLQFLADLAQSEGKWEDPVDRKKVLSEILEAIAVIPDELSRMNYIQELSGISKIGDRTLAKELELIRAQQEKKERIRANRPVSQLQATDPTSSASNKGVHTDDNTGANKSASGPSGVAAGNRSTEMGKKASSVMRRPSYEKELLRLMLVFGEPLILFIGNHCNEQQFEDPDLRDLFEDILKQYQQGKPVSVETYSRKDPPYPGLIGEIVMERHSLSPVGMRKRGVEIHKDAFPMRTARGALKSLKIRYLERVREEYLEKFKQASEEEKPHIENWLRKVTKERGKYQKETLATLFPEADSEENQTSGQAVKNPFKDFLDKYSK
ncbi:DNA primase [Balneolaceae bacterium ANBcel3]|nr:DNA primase [Balneolaceae bacterium ANBcel3]